MSRNTDKIKKALEAKGYVVDDIAWEPIGTAMEKCGPSGGWVVSFELPDDEVEYKEYPIDTMVFGYNVQQVLEEISGLPELKGR